MSTKPTIVMVHGAWHSPVHAEALTKYLESQGYTIEGPYLPSMHAEDIAKVDLRDDIAAVRQSILSALETANVVVVSHSYGTVPATCAMEGLDTASRQSSGERTSITGFMIMAGLVVNSGISTLDQFGGQPAPMHDIRDDTYLTPKPVPGPGWLFYHDVDYETTIKCIEILKPQAWAVNTTVVPFAGHLVVPTRYLICERDNALPPGFQRMMIGTARKALEEKGEGTKFEADTIESGHSPFLSRTEEVGRWVRRYAGGEDVDVSGLGKY